MNQSQRNHAIERIKNLRQKKIEDATVVKEAKTLSSIERINLIRRGAVKLKPQSKINKMWSGNLGDIDRVFDFSKYAWNEQEIIDPKRLSLINKKTEEAIDQIMLGDAEEAIKIIKEFEAM